MTQSIAQRCLPGLNPPALSSRDLVRAHPPSP